MADAKPKNGRIKANADVAGGGVGVLLVWIWNGYVVEPAMPPEVGIPAAILIGRIIRYLLAWLPEPHTGDTT